MTAIILRMLGCLVVAGQGFCPRVEAAEPPVALVEEGMAGNEAVAEGETDSDVSGGLGAEAGESGDGVAHASAVPGDILINEVLAQNVSGLTDELGVPQAWIELYNPGAAAVNLKGWSLTDDAQLPGKWVFPGVTMPAHAYWVVYASGRDLKPTTVGGKLHTNFKLDPRGEYLGLYSPGTPPREISALAPQYPEQRGDYSYGQDAGGQWRYYGTPTPGKANGESTITGKVAAVHFSAARGFYGAPFQLSLSTATSGAAIRYTKDGSVPTERRGQLYTGSIRIESNQVIRAAAFGANRLPSAVATHTYLYGLPANRRLLPALCLATATNNLWGTNGILEVTPRNTTKRGMAWERPVSVELLRTQDNGGFHTDCGLRVQGGDYVRGLYNPKGAVPFNKYSLRLYFRGAYGDSHLDYPLYPDCAVARFDEVSLRAGMNDPTNPFIRDEVVRRLFADTGQASAHGTFVNLFINGVYKGYYNPAERIGVDFLQAWNGGGDQWDLIAQGSQVREGDASAWNALRTYVNGKDLTVAANYQEVGRRLDLVNFIDYLLVNIYVASDDWPGNNWRAARERVAGAPFHFYVWDAEWAFGYSSHTVTWNTLGSDLAGTSEIPQLYKKLKTNAEFRLLFADRVHRHFFNDGALTDARIRARYEAVKGGVASSITGFNDVIGRTWIPGRRPYVLKYLAAAGLLASSNAPVFSVPGGRVARGLALTLTATNGTIWYTTNGTDPRAPFVKGGVRGGHALRRGRADHREPRGPDQGANPGTGPTGAP